MTPLVLLLPLLLGDGTGARPGAPAAGQGGEPKARRQGLPPAVELELRVERLGRELRLDPVQSQRIRRILEDEQMRRLFAAPGGGEGGEDEDSRKARTLVEMIRRREAQAGIAASPELPGVPRPEAPRAMHPVLRGLDPETNLRLLSELDLKQTERFVQLLGEEGLVELKVASVRRWLARRGGGRGDGPAGAAGLGSPEDLAAALGLSGLGGPGLGGLERLGLQGLSGPGGASAGAPFQASGAKKAKRGGGKRRRRRR